MEVPGEAMQHAGVDGWVMRTAARYFNFTPDIAYPEDEEAHGYSEDGITGTGTLGTVMSGRAWISFNGRCGAWREPEGGCRQGSWAPASSH